MNEVFPLSTTSTKLTAKPEREEDTSSIVVEDSSEVGSQLSVEDSV